uniref:Uncharacterized protein n=1 Tax=Avena sativa TaxID=4498 RepID=A0ACD6ADM6_AVESA
MADLAVGLSKTVVEGALARVKTAIQEEAKLRQKAQRDLALISLEFEMMHSFLSVANDEMSTNPHVANDEMSTTKNHLVRTWVRHVRELANDLEDGIELAVDLDDKPIFWRRMLPSCISPELPLDQAVVEIEELKGRAKELSECYMRYSHITDVSAGSKLVMLPQQPSSRATGAIASSVLSKARDAARRRQGLGDLTQLITTENNTEDPSLQVISVWGTGGDLGMTSVIRRAFNDPEVCQNFSCRVWVKLMHPFNPHEFVQRFMAQVYANGWEQPQGARLGVHVLKKLEANQEDLLEEFVEQVNTKTYLVVLDNLIDMIDWDAVRTFLPDMKNGSWIIVSTQQFEIASLCIGHSYQPLELKHFAPDHSVCAFLMQNILSVGGDVSVDSEAPVVTSSISRPDPPTQFFGGAHRGRVCVCAFIRGFIHLRDEL